MGDMHNLQVIISQSSVLSRFQEALYNNAANGAQVLNVIELKKAGKKRSTVQELSKAEKSEKEDPRKRRIKKSAGDHLVDITV
jgi:hypothetical protein